MACAHGFAIDHPLLRIALGQLKRGGFDAREHLGPEDLGQGFVVEEVACLGLAWPLGAPLLVLCVERGGGHDDMDVGVERVLARVRVQHRDGAGDAAKLAVVLTEGA